MKNQQMTWKIHNIKFNLIMNIILKMSNFIFPLITLPYVTRILGAYMNGKVAFAVSVISYFSMFAQLGIPTYGIRVCAACRDDQKKLTKTVHELLVINTISVTVSYITLAVSIMIINKFQTERILLIITSATILLNMLGMDWLYQAIEQYKYITIRNISFKVLTIILIFLMVHNPEDYIIYGILSVINMCGSNILNIINSRKILLKQRFTDYDYKQHLKPIFTFFALSVAVSIYTSMDTIMLGFISGDEQVGYYYLATKIKMALATMISALGPVLLPRISFYVSHNELDKFSNLLKKSLHLVFIVSLPVTVYFFVMTHEVIVILGGIGYLPAELCMRIITLAVIPLGLGNVACMQILAPLGKEKLTMYSTICGAIVNFIANVILIPIMGAAGAALATVFAEIVVMVIQMWCAREQLLRPLMTIKYYKLLLSLLIAFVFLVLLKNLIVLNAIIELILTSIAFFGVYAAAMILFKDEMVIQYFNVLYSNTLSLFIAKK